MSHNGDDQQTVGSAYFLIFCIGISCYRHFMLTYFAYLCVNLNVHIVSIWLFACIFFSSSSFFGIQVDIVCPLIMRYLYCNDNDCICLTCILCYFFRILKLHMIFAYFAYNSISFKFLTDLCIFLAYLGLHFLAYFLQICADFALNCTFAYFQVEYMLWTLIQCKS